jgi:ribonuclease D
VIDSDAKMLTAVQSLVSEKVLGFDTETRPAFKKGESYQPSLIQLAAGDRVYIFQLRHIKSYGSIANILDDKKVLKAGIAVNDDLRKLGYLFSPGSSGFVELAEMASKAGIKNAGLRGLAALLLGLRISKQMKCSRWDASTLADKQIVYAATDAWICRELYFALHGILHGKTHTEMGKGAIKT